jgi:glycosyltransferase involved in cell wall biosynthesis
MESKIQQEYAVSVYMTTYYHEKYIVQALESILSQEVDFKYEIVISDDSSKDGTPSILKRYSEKYDFIRVNYNKENIGLTANMFLAKQMCKGRYIVPLSGDDYWIDNRKLQRQYDFLESHPEYVGVANRVAARTGESSINDFVEPPLRECNKAVKYQDYLSGKNYPLNGIMLRNMIQDNIELFSIMPKVSKYIDDITDTFLILLVGNVYVLDNVTVAYRRRISVKGEHNFNSMNQGIALFEKKISLMNELDTAFEGKYDFYIRYRGIVAKAIAKYFRPFRTKNFRNVYRTIPIKYRKRFLAISSFFNIPAKAVETIRLRMSR